MREIEGRQFGAQGNAALCALWRANISYSGFFDYGEHDGGVHFEIWATSNPG